MIASVLLSLVTMTVPLQATQVPEVRLARHPDLHGDRLAFSYYGDVWLADGDGSDPRRLTVHPALDAFPRFSPDGRWLAFSSRRQGNHDVYIIPVEGGRARQLTVHSSDDLVLGWTPDSRAVLFSSNRRDDFANKLYTVTVEAEMPVPVATDWGYYASYSPDGDRIAYNRKSQPYWRKRYRGSNQSDVIVGDLRDGSFTTLTDFTGMDRWPMWAADGFIYFVSDRGDEPIPNVWRVAEAGGEAEQVTTFTDGDLRWPNLASDRRSIVFERDFGVWHLDLATKDTRPIPIRIAAETQALATEVRTFRDEADAFALAPNGERGVVSIHGELFYVPTDEGDVTRLTRSVWRDVAPQYSPDGAWVAWLSDMDGAQEVYVQATDESGSPQRITELDALKSSVSWAPNSDALVVSSSDNTLRWYDVPGGSDRVLVRSTNGGIGGPVVSPDGNWVAYTRADHARFRHVYLVSSQGGEEHQITFEPFSDGNPQFSPDGERLYFVRRSNMDGAVIGGAPSADIYHVTLVLEETDPSEARGDDTASGPADGPQRDGTEAENAAPLVPDWAGMERRTRQLTETPFPVSQVAVSPEGDLIAFVSNDQQDGRSVPALHVIGSDGDGMRRVAASSVGGGGRGGGGGGGFGGGGGISDVTFSPDGRRLFYRDQRRVFSAAIPPSGGRGGGGSAPSAAGPGGDRGRQAVSFTTLVEIDHVAEWEQMFHDAWRALDHRFYDPEMHGENWDALRDRYAALLPHVGTREELMDILNEMIGELNASHSGARAQAEGTSQNVQTRHAGVRLVPGDGDRYRVESIVKGGPADHDWVDVSEGDYLLGLDGEDVRVGDNYWQILNHPLNEKVTLELSKSAGGGDPWTTRVEPTPMGTYNQLRYEEWVEQRRAMVEELSGGRIGYVHIQSMNQPSLRKFEREIRENQDKEALIIDQRWNGGGNIEQQLLALLAQEAYQILQPRGSEPTFRPAGGFFGPKVVLQNWRSGSNAEMFPAGFKLMELGKIIGTPTAGAVIGTGSYTLIDGSTVRMPGSAVYLADPDRTNMENYGVPPDIWVENSPEDNLAGLDRVIEAAVKELLEQLGRARAVSDGSGAGVGA